MFGIPQIKTLISESYILNFNVHGKPNFENPNFVKIKGLLVISTNETKYSRVD